MMNELRAAFGVRIARGALLQADGRAVGLVIGGGPPWELLARAARAQVGQDYHRLLLTLAGPLDVYLVDAPFDAADETTLLLARQERALAAGAHIQAAVLGEIAGYLADLAGGQDLDGSHGKQIVWAVATTLEPTRESGTAPLSIRWPWNIGASPESGSAAAARQALYQATERARRLADALMILNAAPPPRLPEPEEIAALLYRLADPVRARRFPLHGGLLERVRRVLVV